MMTNASLKSYIYIIYIRHFRSENAIERWRCVGVDLGKQSNKCMRNARKFLVSKTSVGTYTYYFTL